MPSAPASRRLLVSAVSAAIVVATIVQVPASGQTPAKAAERCFEPDVPARFQRHVARAIRVSRDLPKEWADSPFIAKIVCWQGTDFDPDFRKRGGANVVWHGQFAMTTQEMATVFGPWMTANRNAFHLSPPCFVHGWEACPNATANAAVIQQLIAGMRWIWLNYGTPTAAWGHIRRTGRFTSYPRTGTDNDPTRDPLRRCPVGGGVHYSDDFGERRTVGGYHPHWGNDVIAPTGRPVRAPFDGFAVPHSDGWFAGRWVTVVGANGYVRNDHLSRFAKHGVVKAGDIVGYVGSTGDATGPHDHFEWHPWALPTPLHRSPFGFTRIMDAIDPSPFLNRACGASRIQAPAGFPEQPLEG
jgi:hypothetical protein